MWMWMLHLDVDSSMLHLDVEDTQGLWMLHMDVDDTMDVDSTQGCEFYKCIIGENRRDIM